MGLENKITEELKLAMKSKDKLVLTALRAIKSELMIAKTNAGQKKVINNLDKSLSGSLLEEIQTNDMTLQEYGMKMSLLHKEHMDSLATDDEYFFTTTSQDSLEAAKKIEESNQENFEDYLKDFLNKIS